jgi:putative oxidoreductase
MQFLEKLKPLGLLALRLALAATFIFNGYPKLAEPARWLKAFPNMGFPSYFAYISGILDVFGGALLGIGLFTRGAALLLAIEMALVVGKTKIATVGIYAFAQYEFQMVLCAAAFALMTTGAGLFSFDAFTFESRRKASKKSRSKD